MYLDGVQLHIYSDVKLLTEKAPFSDTLPDTVTTAQVVKEIQSLGLLGTALLL